MVLPFLKLWMKIVGKFLCCKRILKNLAKIYFEKTLAFSPEFDNL